MILPDAPLWSMPPTFGNTVLLLILIIFSSTYNFSGAKVGGFISGNDFKITEIMFIIGTDLLPLQDYEDTEFTNTGLTSGR